LFKLQPNTSRSRLTSRSGGISASRSGERLHLGGESSQSIGAPRGKVIRTTTSGSFGKTTTTERKRPALGDKTNLQVSASSQADGGMTLMLTFILQSVAPTSSGEYQKSSQELSLKHKIPSTASLRPTSNNTTKPRSASVTSQTSAEAHPPNAYTNGRHQRGASSSSGVNIASRKVRGKDGEDNRSSIASNITMKRASAGSRGPLQSIVNGMEVDEAGLLQDEQEDEYPLPSQTETVLGSFANVDEDMSEVESDWPSSSAESSSRRHSSKTEADEDDFGAKQAAVMSEGEVDEYEQEGEEEEEDEEDEEEDGSGEESVILNDLDPECYVSLAPEMEDLAQAKVAQICARYEEMVIRPSMMKQAMERQSAVQRGELAPEIAAHDDELALMGLDPDEVRDTSMVAEYSKEIFEYMSRCEARTMANPNYMEFQGEIRW
jgi:hypothetical protein